MNRRKLAELSRDTRFLVQASIFLVVAALLITGAISVLRPKTAVSQFEAGAGVLPDPDAKSLLGVIRNFSLIITGSVPKDFRDLTIFQSGKEKQSPEYIVIKRQIEASTSFHVDERELLLLLLDALHCSDQRRTTAIEKLGEISGDQRYRNEFLGDAFLAANEPEKGIQAYIREGERFPDAAYSQRSAVIACMERKEAPRLREILAKPGFRNAITPHEAIEAAGMMGDYRQLFFEVCKIDLTLLKSPHLITALFTASIWFFILVSMGSLTRPQLFWGVVALLLGIFSGTLTLYVVYLQEHLLHLEFHPDDTLINQIISLVGGIGLREETLKLLCFAPVAIAILKYRSPVVALITAALTGLGFAMMENLQYFVFTDDKFVAWNRLLSANALHFCLTGIVGFSFYNLLRKRGRGWENFLIDFLFVVATHAIYDGFLMIPMLAEYGIVTLILLALTAYRFLDLVRENMLPDGQLRRISPLGVFVLGSALLACGIMVVTSFTLDFSQSAGAFASAIGGSLPVAFAFISRLRDL